MVNLYRYKSQAWGQKPLSRVVFGLFVKRMYRLGPDVSTGFCGLNHVRRHCQVCAVAEADVNVEPELSVWPRLEHQPLKLR